MKYLCTLRIFVIIGIYPAKTFPAKWKQIIVQGHSVETFVCVYFEMRPLNIVKSRSDRNAYNC